MIADAAEYVESTGRLPKPKTTDADRVVAALGQLARAFAGIKLPVPAVAVNVPPADVIVEAPAPAPFPNLIVEVVERDSTGRISKWRVSTE